MMLSIPQQDLANENNWQWEIVIVFLFKASSMECEGRQPMSSRGSFSVPVGNKP